MGGGPASYIPAPTSSALAASFRTCPGEQSSVAGEPTEPPLRALMTNALAHYPCAKTQLQATRNRMLVYCANRRSNQGNLRLPWLSR